MTFEGKIKDFTNLKPDWGQIYHRAECNVLLFQTNYTQAPNQTTISHFDMCLSVSDWFVC